MSKKTSKKFVWEDDDIEVIEKGKTEKKPSENKKSFTEFLNHLLLKLKDNK